MKKQLLKISKLSFFAGAFALLTGQSLAQSSTFNFTGGMQTFTVPCGIDSVFINAWGAQGGSGAVGGASIPGGEGALGGYAEGYLFVTPGDVLNIFVGGQGAAPAAGFNGGGTGGSQNAGGGGGASDVRLGGTSEANRIITAGGGGGGGRGGCDEGSSTTPGIGGNGGFGGGGVGQNGFDSPTSGGAAGGGFGGNFGSIQGALGAAGIGCGGFLGQPGGTASTGTGANGGGGQTCCCSSSNSITGGGGGGGGQIGGGGGGGGSAGTSGCTGNSKGAGAGGGGGSSYTGGVINGAVNNGIWLGNGQVNISWAEPIPPAHIVTGLTTVCEGTSTTYTIPSDIYSTVYTWSVPAGLTLNSGQNTTSINITATTPGTHTIYVNGVNGTCAFTGPTDSIVVLVNALPIVDLISALASPFCGGQDVVLTGTPAGGTFAQFAGPSAALTGSTFNAAGPGDWQITYQFTDANGCVNTDLLLIEVDCMLSLEIKAAEGIMNAFPNPTNGNFTVSSKDNINGKVQLYNDLGQLVFEQAINGVNSKQIELKNVVPGIYQLKITSDGQVFSGKLNVTK